MDLHNMHPAAGQTEPRYSRPSPRPVLDCLHALYDAAEQSCLSAVTRVIPIFAIHHGAAGPSSFQAVSLR